MATKRRRRTKKQPFWQTLGPLLLALVLTPIAVRAASILALSGPASLRVLYPWVTLLENHAMGLSGPQIERYSEWTMWLMLPVYAMSIILIKRVGTLKSGVVFVLLLHTLAVLAAILTA
jgi:hypothetical protein